MLELTIKALDIHTHKKRSHKIKFQLQNAIYKNKNKDIGNKNKLPNSI